MEPIYTDREGNQIYSNDLNQHKIDLYSQKPDDTYSSIFDTNIADVSAPTIKKTA